MRLLRILMNVSIAASLLGSLTVTSIETVSRLPADTETAAPAPLPEALVDEIHKLKPGQTWALVTPRGRCDGDPDSFRWLAFRSLPQVADCVSPDIVVYWKTDPPPASEVVKVGPGFWFTGS